MAIYTYGFKAPRFRKFLNQLAEHGASRTVPAGDSASDAAAEATLSTIARSKSYWKRRIMGHISVALVSDLGDRIAGAPISYALRTARDSENFHAGAAAHILFMESDTACDFRLLAASSDEMNYPLDGAGLLGQPRLSYHFIKYGSMIRKYGSTRTFVRKYSILYLRTKVRKYNYFRTSVLPWVPSYEGTKVLSYLRR